MAVAQKRYLAKCNEILKPAVCSSSFDFELHPHDKENQKEDQKDTKRKTKWTTKRKGRPNGRPNGGFILFEAQCLLCLSFFAWKTGRFLQGTPQKTGTELPMLSGGEPGGADSPPALPAAPPRHGRGARVDPAVLVWGRPR